MNIIGFVRDFIFGSTLDDFEIVIFEIAEKKLSSNKSDILKSQFKYFNRVHRFFKMKTKVMKFMSVNFMTIKTPKTI